MSRTDHLLGLSPVVAVSSWISRHRLRVVAYHDVPDPSVFGKHLDYYVANFNVVSGHQVLASILGRTELPDRALWITFDDGRRSVVESGLPELVSRDLSATAFVCPGLVESGDPYWWSVVEGALQSGPLQFGGQDWIDRRLVTHLKTVDDSLRRSFVAALPMPSHVQDQSMRISDVQRWVSAGMEVGNHTWDHPCLPRCTPEEQRSQILKAQEWLTDRLVEPISLFAYPNGDGDAESRAVLVAMGDIVAVNFDHRLVSSCPDPLAVSRLRLDADAPLNRVRAIAGGAHSAVFGMRSQLRAAIGR